MATVYLAEDLKQHSQAAEFTALKVSWVGRNVAENDDAKFSSS